MRRWLLAAMLLAGCGPAFAQGLEGFGQPSGQPIGPVRNRQYVEFAAEPQTVAAGKPVVLELRFHVRDGFHVNSHQPRSELLTATGLSLKTAEGVKLSGTFDYPAGKPYSLGANTGDPLDVYTDSFVVRVPVVAAAGAHQLDGELVYQACDRAACYPPKKLPVAVLFTAK